MKQNAHVLKLFSKMLLFLKLDFNKTKFYVKLDIPKIEFYVYFRPKWANALFSEIKHLCALILKLNREMPLFCNSIILKSSYMKYSILLWSSYTQVFPALLAFFFLNLYITRLFKNRVSYIVINPDFVLSLCQVECFNVTRFL